MPNALATPTSQQTLRIATRSSELALRQARLVQARLLECGVRSELQTYRTAGDKRLDEPLSAIGAKGLFTRELEADLARGKVDLCVHSLKDLPTEQPSGLEIGAVLEREDPRDVVVISAMMGVAALDELPPGSRVGTSSLRRRAQLLALHPELEVVELRGNVPTRVRKVDEGQVHAAILAAAGLHRLGISERIMSYLDAPRWLPAAGQGAIAVQTRVDDDRVREIVAPLSHAATLVQVRAERAFLGALEGGCQVPIGALAVTDVGPADGGPALYGFIADISGRRVLRAQQALDFDNPELTGVRLANELRRQGASDILEELRRAQKIPAPQPE